MDGPTITILLGAILILLGELWAFRDDKPGNTISERVWWLLGIGRGISWWFVVSRIAVFGFLTWLLLHFAGAPV